MRRIQISGDYGEHLRTVSAPDGSADLDGADLSGFAAPNSRFLKVRSMRGADCYWAVLVEADLSGCDFESADLRGANLTRSRLVGANLRNANLTLDNLGGATCLQGADLTDAILNGAKLAGAQYDGNTRFPKGFSPQSAGMVDEDVG